MSETFLMSFLPVLGLLCVGPALVIAFFVGVARLGQIRDCLRDVRKLLEDAATAAKPPVIQP